jgi:hypothetical protein
MESKLTRKQSYALLIEVLDETMRILPPTVPTFTKLKMYDAPILNLREKKQMTTFTSDDREEAYKKMHEDVVPIPFAGWVNTAPPHIVDSGASVMGMDANELADSIDKYLDSILEEAIHPIEDVLNQSITMLRQQKAEIDAWKRKYGNMST